jgi:hypothetical protein
MKNFFSVVQGWLKIKGNTNGTFIGNVDDKLKTNVEIDTTHLDGTGTIKTTGSQGVFNSFHDIGKANEYWSEILENGATSTWNSNTKSVDLAVTTTSGSKVVRFTKRYFPYLAGAERSVLFTGTLPVPQANLRARRGLFDDLDGIFIQQSGTVLSIVFRSSTSGSAVDTIVERSSWYDPMDGTGPSGKTIDFTKMNLFKINYLWLGIGRRIFSALIDGKYYVLHEIKSNPNLTVPYMSTPNLPFRLELEALDTLTSSGSMSHTCTAIFNDGNGIPTKTPYTANNITTSVSTSNAVLTPILAIRVKASVFKGTIDLIDAGLYITGNSDVVFEIVINPTLTGGTWVSNSDLVEVNRTATSYTNGISVWSQYVRGTQSINFQSNEVFHFVNNMVGVNADNSTVIVLIVARAFSGTASSYASISYRELT